MNSINRLIPCCLALLGLVLFLTTCKKDSYDKEQSLFDNALIETRAEPGVLCKDICQDDLFDFSDLNHNDFVTSYYGAQISAQDVVSFNPLVLGDKLKVRVFDTDRTLAEAQSCNTFDDPDLLFPGGPFGNALVIQDENSPNCANDRRRGGLVTVDYTDLGTITITCLTVFDTEEFGQVDGEPVSGAIRIFDKNNVQIGGLIVIPGIGNGEAQVIEIGKSGIARMEVIFLGSGAVTAICTRADTPECGPDATVLDFEDLAENSIAGTYKGVTISGYPTPAIVFNTVTPDKCGTFDDNDMVLPSPITGLPPAFSFGNVLVNQHASKTACANADPRGGAITFEFPTVSTINSMAFIDTEEKGYVSFYGPDDTYLGMKPIPKTANRGTAFLVANMEGVAKMVVDFGGSGGIDLVCFTPSGQQVASAPEVGCTYDWKWWKANKNAACVDLNTTSDFCGMTYAQILNMDAKGKDYNFLAKEYVTAVLNVTCQGAPLLAIGDEISDALDLLDNCGGVGPAAKALQLQLAHFNQGHTGPGMCMQP